MAICLYIYPQLAAWYICYVVVINMLVGPVFSAGSVTSERERETLRLMAEGRSNSAIASSLHMSEKTVEGHVRSIFSKLQLEPAAEDHRRVLAVLTYLKA